MELDIAIEGVLFYKAGPIKKSQLEKFFVCTDTECATALQKLSDRLQNGAVRLISTDDTVELVVAPELDQTIEAIRKEELKRDIGKAGAETLAIILYRGPVSRVEIDRIRGVNSSYIIRNLEVRGLVERSGDSKQIRYKISSDLLRHLGINNATELSNFAEVMDALEKYETQQETSI